jgi:ribonuclease BN (tRNA processing enzyme)
MIIKFLGSGSAFVLPRENFHSNVLITKDEISDDGNATPRSLLIDAGFQIGEALDHYGLKPLDIDSIFITHNHGDHNGGLEYIGYKTFFTPPIGKNKPVLFSDVRVMETLWENVLKGNMGHLQGAGRVNLSTYFNVKSVTPKQSFQFVDTVFTPVRMTHVVDKYDEIPSFGLKWEEDGVKFFFSGDCQFDFWRLMPFWEFADIVFQECEFMEYENSVHSQFHQLKDIPEKYKKKMWLYHYSLGDTTLEALQRQVLEAGFAGLIVRGQEFNSIILKEELENGNG